MSVVIPQFKNQQDFRNFADSIPEESIREMTADEWIKLYSNLDKMLMTPGEKIKRRFRRAAARALCTAVQPLPAKVQDYIGNMEKLQWLGKDVQSDFAEENIKYFAKLYKNFRLEKKYAIQSRDLARASVKELLRRYPQARSDMVRIAIDKSGRFKERLAERMVKSIYRRAYPDDKLAASLRPRIKVKKLGKYNAGNYDSDFHGISVGTAYGAGMSTIAHEAFHSGHGVSPLQKLLKLAGHRYTFEDDKMSRLYELNARYYICGDELIKTPEFKAYDHQPMEYAANFFAAQFERAARQEIGAEHFNVLLPRRIARVMDMYNLKAEKYAVGGKNNEYLDIFMPELKPREKALLAELNEKYLLGRMVEFRGQTVVCFDKDASNERRMKEQLKELREESEKHKNDKDGFYRTTVPDTVARFGIPQPPKNVEAYIREVGAKIARLKRSAIFVPAEQKKKIQAGRTKGAEKQNDGR